MTPTAPTGPRGRLCSEYRRDVARFTRVDGVLALLLVAVSMTTLWFTGIHARTGPDPELWTSLWWGIAEALVWAGVIVVIALARRQGLGSVGYSRTHLRRSLLAGLAVAGLLVAVTAVVGAATGSPPHWRPLLFTYGAPYYLIVIGFAEEALWRGFVTPRVAAQFERHWVGVALAGVLFGLMHAPFTMALNDIGVTAFLAEYWWRLVVPFAWHFVLWFLYARFNSLAAPTLVHFAMNWSGEMVG